MGVEKALVLASPTANPTRTWPSKGPNLALQSIGRSLRDSLRKPSVDTKVSTPNLIFYKYARNRLSKRSVGATLSEGRLTTRTGDLPNAILVAWLAVRSVGGHLCTLELYLRHTPTDS